MSSWYGTAKEATGARNLATLNSYEIKRFVSHMPWFAPNDHATPQVVWGDTKQRDFSTLRSFFACAVRVSAIKSREVAH